MSRHSYCVPTPYTALLRRVTLLALLCAGGGGIAWSCYALPRSELGGMNERMDAANDVLMYRAGNPHAIGGAGEQGPTSVQAAAADLAGDALAASRR
jgi:hypothetical protein